MSDDLEHKWSKESKNTSAPTAMPCYQMFVWIAWIPWCRNQFWSSTSQILGPRFCNFHGSNNPISFWAESSPPAVSGKPSPILPNPVKNAKKVPVVLIVLSDSGLPPKNPRDSNITFPYFPHLYGHVSLQSFGPQLGMVVDPSPHAILHPTKAATTTVDEN